MKLSRSELAHLASRFITALVYGKRQAALDILALEPRGQERLHPAAYRAVPVEEIVDRYA